MEYGYTLFETAVGWCGIAWGERGIVAVQVPESNEAETRAWILQQCPSARHSPPPAPIQSAIDGILALLRGESRDLSDIVLDMDGLPPFHRRVYEAARTIPPGATASYGELAAGCGAPGAARAVGQALGRNPFGIVVPCHRVVAAGGRIGGFSGTGGVATKLKLLSLEGVRLKGAPSARASGPRFDPRAAEAHLRASDPGLAALIDTLGPFHLPLDRAPSLFVALAQSIVYQQLSGKAASTIFGRVRALFPDAQDGLTAEHILGASEQALRSAGVSRPKILALQDLARRTSAGELPTLEQTWQMDDEAIIDRLTRVRGIGRWSVEMVLIFRLGRPDVLPLNDHGIRKGFAVAFGLDDLPSQKELEERGLRWRPYRTVASWYLWQAADRGRS